jgi:hydroxymethylbilane synthase
MTGNIIRIGTRGSKLALVQTDMVAAGLRAAHPGLQVEIVIINTSGDWKPEQGETRLSPDAGGKALFAKEIEAAILAGAVDCGVHSLKDMPAILPDGLVIDHVLPRADVRDALLTNGPQSIMDLPPGAVVGTASLRRQAFVLAKRPDLKVVPLRGNVPTRIEKLRSGQVDAAILAMAGLTRLGLGHEVAAVMTAEDMLPAGCQGIVGIERRAGDARTGAWLDALHDFETGLCAVAERAALAALGGSCHTPVGALAVRDGDTMRLRLKLADPDGSRFFEETVSETVRTAADADLLGTAAGETLRRISPAELLAA